MSNEQSNQSGESVGSPRFLPFLILLFAASGSAALIYEIVWFQMLRLVIGSSAISLAVLLGTFMGGMCLGCLALPRLVSERRHPLRVYAFIELTIGIIGLAVLWCMPHVDQIYVAIARGGSFGIVLRAPASAPMCAASSHCADGRHSPGHCPLDQSDATGHFLVGVFLWRKHCGRRVRLPAGRLLSSQILR